MKHQTKQLAPLIQFTNDLVQMLNTYIADLEDVRRRYSVRLIKKHTRIPLSSATVSFLQEPYLGMAAKLQSLSERADLQLQACERASSAFRRGYRDFANLRSERQVESRADKLSIDMQSKLLACVRQLAYSQNYLVTKFLSNDPVAISLMQTRMKTGPLLDLPDACVI